MSILFFIGLWVFLLLFSLAFDDEDQAPDSCMFAVIISVFYWLIVGGVYLFS